MGKGFVVLIFSIAIYRSCSCLEEPRCSKYDFEEKVLEKVLRFEHKMEIMANTLNEISTKVKDDIHNMQTEQETRGVEQATAFNAMEKNLQAEWTGMKKAFEDRRVEQTTAFTEMENLQTEWTDTKKSFEDLSGIPIFLPLDVRIFQYSMSYYLTKILRRPCF